MSRKKPLNSLAPKSNSPVGNDTYDLLGCFKRGLFPVYERHYRRFLRDLECTVLDLGCGFGSDFMLWLREDYGFSGKMMNMDRDPAVFDDEHRHADMRYWQEGDENLVGEAEAIPLEDGSVALVHQQGLFADFEDRIDARLVFREIYRVLKPNGLYIMNDTVGLNELDGFIKLLINGDSPTGIYRRLVVEV